MGKLTALSVKAAKTAGRYGDGDGLALIVKASGSRSWVVRVQKDGNRRDIGLGSEKKLTLTDARDKAKIVRTQMQAGLDPVQERVKNGTIPTFRKAAADVLAEQKGQWRNPKHQKQWLATLEAYAFPAIGDIAVNLIEHSQVCDLLKVIWQTKNETARRVRQRIGLVIDWAVAKGYRETALPMAVINKGLLKVAKSAKHHPAMPYDDLPAFLDALRAKPPTPSRLALEFLILTAARSGEVRLADWSEIDWTASLWSIPSERMKMKRDHVVPLSAPALSVLARLVALTGNNGSGLMFPGMKRGKPMSDMTMTKLLRDAELEWVPHGFRSSFRDWVSEETTFEGETAEQCLAHVVKNATERAYRRGTQLDKRRALMAAWADHCVGGAGNVLRLVV